MQSAIFIPKNPKGAYMSDFIEVDYSQMNIKQLINQLDKLDNHAINQIMPEVMQAVGNELLQEEKRGEIIFLFSFLDPALSPCRAQLLY